MKIFLFNFFRTAIMFIICVMILLFSGRMINFLPAILKAPVILLLLPTAILYYFSISYYDIISTILGLLLSLLFILNNVINIVTLFPNIFMNFFFMLSTILIIAQTLNSVKIRFANRFKDEF